MSLGLILFSICMLSFIGLVVIGIRMGRDADNTVANVQYRCYADSSSSVEHRTQYIPYDSYEFAGVKGAKRVQLQQSRKLLLEHLSLIPNNCKLWNLVVIPDEMVRRHYHSFTPLPWSSVYTSIAVLSDGRKYLGFFENAVYLVAVETSADGIPFGLEDLSHFEPTNHWVTLATIEHRQATLKELGLLQRMVHNQLNPGNY